MKAAIYYKRGGLDVIQYQDVPDPKLEAGEILVRVRACGLNHLDIYTREGSHGVKAPLPHIGGLEPSGEVAALGAGVNPEASTQALGSETAQGGTESPQANPNEQRNGGASSELSITGDNPQVMVPGL